MPRSTRTLLICLVITAAGVGYYFFGRGGANDATLVTTSGMASDAELSFIALVSKLDPIVFDTTLLSDPRFMSRQNIRTAIIPETTGRKDPFAPLGR